MKIRQTLAATSTEFTARNIVLKDGWVGIETDTGKQKTGDGTAAWAMLEYTTPAVPGEGIASNPPPGYKKITNLYVDANGEVVIVYDP